MDQFGVLVESIGFKSQGRSAPIADLKGKTGINNGFPQNLGTNAQVNANSSLNSFDTSFIDDLDGIFRSSRDRNQTTSNGLDDLFGVPTTNPRPSDGGLLFDLDSVFNGSSNPGPKPSNSFDDIFGELAGSKSTTSVYDDNVFANFASVPKKSESVDDLFGAFSGIGSKSNSLRKNGSNSDDSPSGFRLRPPPNGKIQMKNEKPSNEPRPKENSQRRNEPRKEEAKVDLDSFFGMDARQTPSRSLNEDSMFDKLFPSRDPPKVERTSSWTPSEPKKNSPVTDIDDDFSFFFEMGGGQRSGNFQEIEGESEDRRKARLKHHQKTQERMARALNEKTQRDLKTQREQEERHRLSDSLDGSIKHWATGKEGNLRALLSSLQYVLWPECGWQPVSLTDLITSTSVKKVYYKATLCVHPDKVQQKGANLQQRFIAEKVFDLLKEAWTKFNKEEL